MPRTIAVFAKLWSEVLRGRDAGDFAGAWIKTLSPRELDHLLWDVSLKNRGDFLAATLSDAELVCAAWFNEYPVGLAWASSILPGSATAIVHFSLNDFGRPHKAALGRHFLERACDAGLKTLLCLIPWPWRAERAYAASLGFKPLHRARNACLLAARNRFYDGAILARDLGAEETRA